MAKIRYTLLALAVVVSLFFLYESKPETAKDPKDTQLCQEVCDECLEVIKNPFHVYVYAVDPKSYERVGKERPLNQKQVEVLQALLLNDDNYYFDQTKQCPFVPEIAFLFVGYNNKEVTVYSSFTCKQLNFTIGDHPVIIDCDPMTKELEQHFFKFLFILNH